MHGQQNIKKKIQITVANHSWLNKQHVSALFGHHQAYKDILLIKVHSLAITNNFKRHKDHCKPWDPTV